MWIFIHNFFLIHHDPSSCLDLPHPPRTRHISLKLPLILGGPPEYDRQGKNYVCGNVWIFIHDFFLIHHDPSSGLDLPHPPRTRQISLKLPQILGGPPEYGRQGKNYVCRNVRNFILNIFLNHHILSYGLDISAYRGPPFFYVLPPHLRTRSHIYQDSC